MRLDRWLWAARFYKTRALATEAVQGGHVQVAGKRAKPGRALRCGDRVSVTRGGIRKEVDVVGLALRRGPASEAEGLYVETAQSVAEREAAIQRMRAEKGAQPTPSGRVGGRPTKRDRRAMEKSRPKDGFFGRG